MFHQKLRRTSDEGNDEMAHSVFHQKKVLTKLKSVYFVRRTSKEVCFIITKSGKHSDKILQCQRVSDETYFVLTKYNHSNVAAVTEVKNPNFIRFKETLDCGI